MFPAGEAIARLSRAGFVCPVVTVQSRIAKGLFSAEEFLGWFRDFAKLLHNYGAEIEPVVHTASANLVVQEAKHVVVHDRP